MQFIMATAGGIYLLSLLMLSGWWFRSVRKADRSYKLGSEEREWLEDVVRKLQAGGAEQVGQRG